MIRVSVLYPNGEGVTFDHDYYRDRHMPLCGDRLGAYGLLRYEIDRGLPDAAGKPPPYVAACHFFFAAGEDAARGFAAAGAELAADVPNYTNAQAIIQTSEVIES
jgi:uncharacterized protein (TIGR02118 family)